LTSSRIWIKIAIDIAMFREGRYDENGADDLR
jgi:hypothetical protein